MAERTRPPVPPGFNEKTFDSGVFFGTIKVKYINSRGTNIERELTVVRDINKGTFQYESYDLGVTYVYAVGNPVAGLTFNPEDNATVKTFLSNPELVEAIKRASEKDKQETKNLVLQNNTLDANEQNKILNSPYYQGVATSTPAQNTGGRVFSVQELSNLEIKASKESQNFGMMRYPLNSGGTNLDYIKFGIFESVPSKFGGYPDKDGKIQGRIAQFTNKEYAKSIGTIYLPIQPSINDTNAVDWGEDTMGLLQMTAANISLAITGGGAATIENIADQISLEGAANRDDIIKATRALISDTLAKSGSNVVTRVTGAMLNPNLELLFKGPKLRQFTYTIKLTPRSQAEGNMVRKIIRAFKQNMAPRLAANNYFLKTPNVFSIDYVLNNEETNIKGLNKIKKSALMSCSVNYTPANNYMPFKDGTMTSYELMLQFQELLPIYDEDYLGEFADTELNTNSANEKITIGY